MPAPEWANLKVGYAASESAAAACSGNTTAASQPAERPDSESARQALLLISSEPGSTLIVEAKLAPASQGGNHSGLGLWKRAKVVSDAG